MEFSRDRKSMSVYCRPTAGQGDGNTCSPIMFVKVRWQTASSLSPDCCVCICVCVCVCLGSPGEYSGEV